MTQLTNRQLDILAAQIRSVVDKLRKSLLTSIDIAVDLGGKLNRAKSCVPHGDWGSWVEENCDMSERQARKYMQLDRNQEKIEDHDTIHSALNAISGPKKEKVFPVKTAPEAVLEEINSEKSAAGEGGSPGGNGQGPVAHEEWEEEEAEEDPIAESIRKPAWQVQADRHRVWVNDLNRIRREVKSCEDEYDYMRHCSLRVIQDLRQVVATLSQNTPVDETWKTKGELESRRR